MLQVLDNLRQLCIFSNYTGEIDYFTLDLLKTSNTYEEFLIVDHPKEDHTEQEFKR